jgi:hypothetical protein
MKLKNAGNQTLFETTYLGESIKKIAKTKGFQKCHHFLGYFIFSKSHNQHQKVAKLA